MLNLLLRPSDLSFFPPQSDLLARDNLLGFASLVDVFATIAHPSVPGGRVDEQDVCRIFELLFR